MVQSNIFSDTLGLIHPWLISAVAFSPSGDRIDITIDFDYADRVVCPDCGAAITPVPGETETWYHDDFLQYTAYLYARIPQLVCACGRQLAVERPWSRNGSRFSRRPQE